MDKIIRQTFEDIKLLKVQGATAVARTIIQILSQYGSKIKTDNISIWKKNLNQAADNLLLARPTEPMAQNGVKFVFFRLKEKKDAVKIKKQLKEACHDFLTVMDNAAKKIIPYGQKIISHNDNILTHCHSWLVEQLLIQAKKNKKKFQVFNTETRPLFQGRITSEKLIQAGIPNTMITDSSAGFLISHYSGKKLMMDKVILGADALLPDGSVINKIGSFTLSLVAYEEKVPLYVVAPLLKFHNQSWIKIEKRSPKEIWPKSPKKLKIINFAFDTIPEKYITGLICEAGLIKPRDIRKYLKKIYPFL